MPSDLRMAVFAAARHAALAAASIVLVVSFMIVGAAGGAANRERDAQAPSAPAHIGVVSVTATMVGIGWEASTDDVGVVGYYVYVDGDRSRVDGTRYDADRLECGSSVSVGVEAFDRARNRSSRAEAIVSTAPCPDAQPPTPPSDFRQDATTQNSVVISWAPSTDNVGVVGYAVYRDGFQIDSTPQPTTTLQGLSCGSVYAVAADAVDAAGNRSLRGSAWVLTADCSDGQPPSAPTNLAASGRTASSISLTWSASTDDVGVTGYGVSVDGAPGLTVTEPSATVENLTCGTSYEVGVDASDAAANRSLETTINASTAECSSPPPPPPSEPGDTAAPAAPTGLAVSSVTQTTLTFTWNASSDNVGVTGYDVYRNNTKLATVTATSLSQTALTCGTSYTLAVEAFDATGNRSQRAQLSATTADCSQPPPPLPGDTIPPSQPTALAVQAANQTSVTLVWTPATDNVGVAGYGVYRSGTSVSSPSQPGATISGLSCGTAYAFEVDAFDAAGNRSSRAAVTVPTTACADTQPPTAPTNVTATVRTATSVALSWSASSDNIGVVGYGLYKAATAAGTSVGTTGIFAGLTCNTNYTIAVDAYDAAGNRSPKTVVMVATTACPDTEPPSTPTGLSVSNVSASALTLNWNASTDNEGVTGYDVYRGGAKMASVSSTSSGQSGLTCATSYSFGVEARDAAGNRSQRGQLTASTASCPPPPSGETLDWIHPYPSTSIWRQPIQANPAVDPNNAVRITEWLNNSVVGHSPNMVIHDFGVAVVQAEPNAPRYTPSSSTGWADALLNLGPVPIPLGAKADPSSDGHIVIWDPSTENEYGMWVAEWNGTNWSRGGGYAHNTRTGDGIVPAPKVGATAANFPLLGGLIRPEEIEADVIEHALQFAMPNASTGFVKPATHGTGSSFNALRLQAGNRLQLDPSLNVDALPIQPWEKTVARALQKYGMYLRDGGGALGIYAENPINREESPDYWTRLGLPSRGGAFFSSSFPWSQMRILVPPS